MSRRNRYRNNSREPGKFVALPWAVLDSAAFQALSHPAKALLLEVARQYRSDNNGRMLLTDKYLAPRGWRSPYVITRAKRELIDVGLIFETVKGARPNKASWYAVTWQSLDPHPGYDAGVHRAFARGAYKLKNASLTTGGVVGRAPIATGAVVDQRATTTGAVAIPTLIRSPSTTGAVDHLDLPSAERPARGQGHAPSTLKARRGRA